MLDVTLKHTTRVAFRLAEFNGYYKTQQTVIRLLGEFGLTPKSRKNITIEQKDEMTDPITDMINN